MSANPDQFGRELDGIPDSQRVADLLVPAIESADCVRVGQVAIPSIKRGESCPSFDEFLLNARQLLLGSTTPDRPSRDTGIEATLWHEDSEDDR